MKLEINTNGAWRTVIAGIGRNVDAEALGEAQRAAATLACVDARLNRRPHSWRLVDEATGKTVETCSGQDGWRPARGAA